MSQYTKCRIIKVQAWCSNFTSYVQDTALFKVWVQRRFTKRLRVRGNYSYPERLRLLQLHSLEVRRLVIDLVWCYKIVFHVVDVCVDEFFFLLIAPPPVAIHINCTNHIFNHYQSPPFSERVMYGMHFQLTLLTSVL